MRIFNQHLPDEIATERFGRRLGQLLAGRGMVFLEGELGAGKTTLSRGILRGMGHKGAVKSPTFTLVEPYDLGDKMVYHFDLYRLQDPQELEYLGIDDYLEGNQLCLVEWPDKGAGHLPPHDLRIELLVLDQGRQCTMTAFSGLGDAICVALLESA